MKALDTYGQTPRIMRTGKHPTTAAFRPFLGDSKDIVA